MSLTVIYGCVRDPLVVVFFLFLIIIICQLLSSFIDK